MARSVFPRLVFTLLALHLSPLALPAVEYGDRGAAREPERHFPPDAVVDVTAAPYHAIPDDGQDDTAALQRAIRENMDTGRPLYFPAGVYEISQTLEARNAEGLWRPHLTLQGQSRRTTVIRLAEGAPGFGDPANPRAMVATGSMQQGDDDPAGGGNKAFRNNIMDLRLETGQRNPGAMGIEWAVSNQGTISRVEITGEGVAGIAMKRKIPGPGFIKDVSVNGFDVGIDIGDMQYGFTLEHVTLRGQKTAGLRISENLAHVRRLDSEGPVLVTGYAGSLTMVQSRIGGLDCAGTLYLREVEFTGEIRTREGVVAAPAQGELSSPPALGAPEDLAMAPLEIQETPEFWNADLKDWAVVGERLEGESDDTLAIQRAMDAGKSTVYFRNTRIYHLSDTVEMRGKTRQLIGMGAEINLGTAEEPFSNVTDPRPLIRIRTNSADTVFIQNVFFNAQYPGEVIFEHDSPATLVITQCAGWVGLKGHRRSFRNTSTARGAKVFVEDAFLPGWEFTGLEVWARQFNPENYDGDGATNQVTNTGSRLWILGFKTEGPAPFIVTQDGGRTELLGAYNYISASQANPLPHQSVPYLARTGGQMRLTFASENFRPGGDDYHTYIQGGASSLPPSKLPPRWDGANPGSRATGLYRSPK